MATLKRSWKGSVLTGFSHDLSGWWFFNHLEKYDFVNGKDYPIPYIMENKIHV